MTASTLSRLPVLAGSAVAASLARAGLWTWSQYMRAPLASTALLGLVALTALASSNALFGQTTRHPSPFFQPTANVAAQLEAVPVPLPASERPVAAIEPVQQTATVSEVAPQTTGSVPAAAPAIPDQPVGNADAFAVQKKLAQLGLFEGKVDGFYGPMTARAIRAFEERNGLEPTGALTPDIIDAIKRADSAGRVPTAQPVAQPQAQVIQPAPVAEPTPVQRVAVAPQPQQDRVVQRLPTLSPIDAAVDTVGSAAAQTIDSIVAAVGGAPTPAAAVTPVPAMPVGNQAAATPAREPEPQQLAYATTAASPPQAAPRPPAAVAPANDTRLVSEIQRGLASLGFYRGSIDGHPGEATARAIREFENFHRYRVTGEIKPDLIELLRQAGAPV
jgi:peptidoglycan hydrolase-like protein with peptidoglycan-binding domain